MNIFKRPYPLKTNIVQQLTNSLWFALFVFAFLYLFKPFGLSELESGLLRTAVGFGLVTLLLNGGLQVILPKLFTHFYSEEKWNLGRNILSASAIILVVAFGNFLWAHHLNFTSLSLNGMLTFIGYTIAVGIFPVSFLMLLEQNRLNNKFLNESETINEHFKRSATTEGNDTFILLKNEDGSEAFRLAISQFFFCKSADNYIELYYVIEGDLKKELFRNSLKNIEKDLSKFAPLKRVHRSYFVNLSKVKSVDGNARGLKLLLSSELPQIPISRSKHDEILSQLDSN